MADIHIKINQIMKKIPAIGKEKTNKQQGFQYRGIDDVMNALFPLLGEHGVFMVPEVLDTTRTERTTKSGGNMAFTVAKVKYTFFAASDGSSVSAITVGEGMDSADKSTNKAMAAAMKYALFQTFCIPTEEMQKDDPDRETVEPSRPKLENPVGLVLDANRGEIAFKPVEQAALTCENCGDHIGQMMLKSGTIMGAEWVANETKRQFGRALCPDCWKRIKGEAPRS